MKLMIDLEANVRQFIWPRVGKYLEKFQALQPKKSLSSIPYDTLEYRSISSNESLVTCYESFRNTMENGVKNGNNPGIPNRSPNEIVIVSDELVSIISTTNDTNSYKDIDFSCISSLEFPSSEIKPSRHISKEGSECSAPFFNDELAGLIEDMILVLEDPYRSVDQLPDIKELEINLDCHEVTRALSIV